LGEFVALNEEKGDDYKHRKDEEEGRYDGK
jgi:hypothetical protein